jgi:hypothetical protein
MLAANSRRVLITFGKDGSKEDRFVQSCFNFLGCQYICFLCKVILLFFFKVSFLSGGGSSSMVRSVRAFKRIPSQRAHEKGGRFLVPEGILL